MNQPLLFPEDSAILNKDTDCHEKGTRSILPLSFMVS